MVGNGYTVYSHITPSAKMYFGITKRKVVDRWRNGFGYKHRWSYA